MELAEKYKKTAAQIMLRWQIQRGIVVIPKSTHYERMQENFDVFDFVLTDEDMQRVAALDTATSSFFSHQDPAIVEWFAKMVEERKKNHRSENEKMAW
jgi:2,5-diketo-D-gluconate reductase A